MDTVSTILVPKGEVVVEHWRDQKLFDVYYFDNDSTLEGKNAILNANFYLGTQYSYWWLGLINSASYTGVAASDTYQNINLVNNGWIEFTSYVDTNSNSSLTRPLWIKDPVANQGITNTSKSLYTITSSATLTGIFTVGGTAASSTARLKGDNTIGNILWATALFNNAVTVIATDVLKMSYSISL